ncbi:hypothetical protein [Leptospira interrogans]|uniref:hypothetical protein n=2 Tax=Leptospira interrogans TaxID=173 RepID=UPI0002B9EC5A|nr:hypothetical protein [Leptospira interrogans]EMN94719.1 hypothetical protein LEP1GSC110_3393 [Leptospira interrogans serovar Medanensis str. UT053]EMO96264.1 hypothetical protein LEP1GSC109_3262 [Leptospira interrogans str. UI 13372]
MGIYLNGAVEIKPSMDETKVPRIQVRLMGDEESGNYSFTISESKFRLLEKAILEKNSIEPKQTEAGNDLGSLEVD